MKNRETWHFPAIGLILGWAIGKLADDTTTSYMMMSIVILLAVIVSLVYTLKNNKR